MLGLLFRFEFWCLLIWLRSLVDWCCLLISFVVWVWLIWIWVLCVCCLVVGLGWRIACCLFGWVACFWWVLNSVGWLVWFTSMMSWFCCLIWIGFLVVSGFWVTACWLGWLWVWLCLLVSLCWYLLVCRLLLVAGCGFVGLIVLEMVALCVHYLGFVWYLLFSGY